MTDEIRCNLVGNALDYLLLAGEMAKQDTPRMLKHAIATLADGLELLLKARLEDQHWSLLFKNIDEADRKKFDAGDFQSVTFEQAVQRLRGISGIEVGARHLPILNALRRQRNKIRHFALTVEAAEALSLLSSAYSFAIEFTTVHLEADLDDQAQADLDSLRRLLGEFGHFVTARLTEIQGQLDQQARYSNHAACPGCLQPTLYSDAGEASCLFCGYRATGDEAAAAWFEQHYGHYRDKDWMILRSDLGLEDGCPECGSDAVIPLEEADGCHCLSCGQTSERGTCGRCHAKCYGEVCDFCRHIMEKDD